MNAFHLAGIKSVPFRTLPDGGDKFRSGLVQNRGSTMASAMILAAILGGLLVALVAVIILNNVIPIERGLPNIALFVIISFSIIFTSYYFITKRQYLAFDPRVRYKDRDSNTCSRVIKDGINGSEIIVCGKREDTFAEACRKHWQFLSVEEKSKWYIKDERGNDVTDRFLETADGVFVLIPEYGSEISQTESDETSSIHDSVEYYE